jgi:hypothetical protein
MKKYLTIKNLQKKLKEQILFYQFNKKMENIIGLKNNKLFKSYSIKSISSDSYQE